MEFQTEKEDILEAIRDLTRDIRLKSARRRQLPSRKTLRLGGW